MQYWWGWHNKCYFVIYKCAILDLLPNALADVFVNSLSKFISRRGCPQIILSDNDSPFAADPTKQFVNDKNI